MLTLKLKFSASPLRFLLEAAQALNIPLPPHAPLLFEMYFRTLCAWNAKTNLTTIVDGKGVYLKHFIDSLLPERFIPHHAHVVDIGSGAGFPGIPLAIVRSDLKVTLVDASLKKIYFQRHVIRTLKIAGTVALHERAENIILPHNGDIVFISRAFSNLARFLSIVSGLKGPRDIVIAMKGPTVKKELELVAPHLAGWKMSIKHVEMFSLPFTHHKRAVVIFE